MMRFSSGTLSLALNEIGVPSVASQVSVVLDSLLATLGNFSWSYGGEPLSQA